MKENQMTEKNFNDSLWEALPFFVTLLVLAAVAFVLMFLTSPVEKLLGEGAHAFDSALHGLLAGLLMVTVTVGLFEGYRLLIGNVNNIRELIFGSLVNSALAFLTIVTGNKIYIAYRAKEGPRTYFLETAPEIHKIFFEFKEFIALLVFPLAVAATFIFIYYRKDILESKSLRVISFVLLILMFFYFVVTFGLGAAITKLKSV